GYIRIKNQGGINYVHGGVSLQEIVVPLIEFRNLRSSSKDYIEIRKVGLQLLSQSRKINNTMFHLDFYQPEPVNGKVIQNEFKLYFTDESGKMISDIQMIIADKTTNNVKERVFRKRFKMKNQKYSKTEKYYLNIVEKNSSVVSEHIEYTINIAFADDFDF
ncbi:MAG: BREX-1 system phosphatase PglZ type A, partial [Oscillospiraceae bacterium]|nr:BREX-1 system phosphatase PglZ type A [Oscillospiraceae bacterium]